MSEWPPFPGTGAIWLIPWGTSSQACGCSKSASDSKVQVVPPSPGEIIAVTFSPDGSNLYYVRDSQGLCGTGIGRDATANY